MQIYSHRQMLRWLNIFFFSPALINARTKPQRNPLKHNIYSRRSKCVDLNMNAWFSEFPGERESVTCWRELQSDKRRPQPPLLLEPLVLSHVRLFKHVVEMVVVAAVGVRRSASLNFCTTINMEKEPRGQCGVIQSALARKLNHSHSCHAMSNRLAIQWSGKGGGGACGDCIPRLIVSSLRIRGQRFFLWTTANIKKEVIFRVTIFIFKL